MALSQKESKRQVSGARYAQAEKKRLAQLAGSPALTKLGEKRVKVKRMRSGATKRTLLAAKTMNVYDPQTKKQTKTEIVTIVENPANRHFVRRNIITKGTIVTTSLGQARVTSRPGQVTTINGVLLEAKKA